MPLFVACVVVAKGYECYSRESSFNLQIKNIFRQFIACINIYDSQKIFILLILYRTEYFIHTKSFLLLVYTSEDPQYIMHSYNRMKI